MLRNAIVNTTVPTGAIMSYVFNDEPAGWLRLDGRVLTNANQVAPQFVAKLNEANNKQVGEKLIIGKDEWERIERTYGSCGKFCWIGANLRFPKITGFIKGLTDITQLGRAELDTMRPITGTIGGQSNQNTGNTKGAFYVANVYGRNGGLENWAPYADFGFDSSRLGANYNGAETQPKCVKYPYIMSVFNKVQWTSQLDYDNLIRASINKADVDLSNVESINLPVTLKEEIVSWITPDWESAISFNGNFTAPSNGWVLAYSGSNDWQNVNFNMNNVTYLNTGRKSYNTATCMTFFIQKGRTFNATSSGGVCRFIPCKLR